MKNFLSILFSVAVFCLVAGCSKSEYVNNGQSDNKQIVTISASVSIPTEYNSKVQPDDLSKDIVSFHWESGDCVTLVQGNDTSVFSIIESTINGSSACFSGEALADMSKPYDAYYNFDLTSDVQEVDYVSGSFKPFITGSGCGNSFVLDKFLPVIRIKVKQRIDDGIASVDYIKYYDTNDPEVLQNYDSLETHLRTRVCMNYMPLDKTEFTTVYLPLSAESSNGFTLVFWNGGEINVGFSEDEYIGGFYLATSTSLSINKIYNFDAGLFLQCFAQGTKITMSDGSQKNIEDIVHGDMVRTFDHEAGCLSSQKVSLVYKGESKSYSFTLSFEGGKTLDIVGCHDLLEKTSRKYVVINQLNARTFIGKEFYDASSGSWIKLTSVTDNKVPVNYYSIYSAYNLNCIANGMLTVPDDIDALLNIYDLDDNLRADPVQLAADIERYGLVNASNYSQFDDLHQEFDELNAKYYLIAVGKGYVSKEELWDLFGEYQPDWQK